VHQHARVARLRAAQGRLMLRIPAPGGIAGARAKDLRTHTQRLMTVRTFSPKAGDIQRQWHVIDANEVVLGRLASQAAILLRGKHKPIFAPHVDTGDFVIVVNAEKIALSGNKLADKRAYRHSGYPGGLRSVAYGDLLAKHPERAVEKAVKGMLPKNTLGRQMLRKLKVYAGPDHPHRAQQPVPFEITQIAQQAGDSRAAAQ
jgi:large subunit ribosomal protein L13